jgi:TonB family protein
VGRPRVALAFWQVLLGTVLIAPWLVPGHIGEPGRIEVTWLGSNPPGAQGDLPGKPGIAEAMALVLGAGVLVRAGRVIAGLRRLRKCRNRAVPLDPRHPALAGSADRRTVEYLISEEVSGPGTFGLIRPAVLLPRALLAMPLDRQRAVIAHERTHVLRRDWLWSLLEEIVSCVFWFHPAVHLVLARVRLSREQRVDELVVQRMTERRPYLEALVEIAGHAVRRNAVPATLLLEEGHLRARIDLLLKEVPMSRWKAWFHAVACGLVVLTTGAGVAGAVPLLVIADGPQGEANGAGKSAPGSEPRLVHKVNPVYPEEAKKNKIEGQVLLDVRVGRDGTVVAVSVKSGHEALAPAAVAAVQQWKYEPILGPDGKPAEVSMTITINFRLS